MALLLYSSTVFSQLKSTSDTDSSLVRIQHSPGKATLMSAIVPGLGQVYNKKYWKVPIIYAGIGAGIYFASFSHDVYSIFREAYIAEADNDPNTINPYPWLTEGNLESEMERYRGYFEMSIIGIVIVYALNIVDANVDGHLFDFDVSDNLSLNLRPNLFPSPVSNTTFAGLTMGIRLH